MYKLKLISRYLRARRITVIPIGAVAVAVFLLIVVLAVMNGFSSFIQGKIRGTVADIIVEHDDVRGFDRCEELAARLEKIPGVAAASPHLSGKALLTLYDDRTKRPFDFPCVFIGVDLDAENRVSRLRQFVTEPQFNWTAPSLRRLWLFLDRRDDFDLPVPGERLPGLILGAQVIEPYQIYLGYHAGLTTPTATDEDSSMDFRVTAKFTTGLYEYDRTTVYTRLGDAQKLMRLPGHATSIHLRADRGADLDRVKADVAAALPDRRHFVVKTWMESQKVLIDAMRFERILWVVILSAMLAVAGFCILAVMSLTVLQKTRDIGILRAIGGSVGGILSAFIQYGVVTGAVGATIGLAGAFTVLYYINPIERFVYTWTRWTPWPREVFYFDRIPCDISGPAMLTFWAWGVAVAFAASILPAVRAARTDPIRTLRYEH